jgi:hypothetical protein
MSVKKTWICAVSSLLLVTGLANAGNGQSRPAAEEGAEDAANCASSVPVPLPALPTCAGTIPRYAACELELTSARPEGYYHNPFTDVAVRAHFTNGSQTLTAYGFYDGGRTWRIRFAPPTEEGTIWTYTVSNSAADTGLQVPPSVPAPSRSFAVGEAAAKGFIEIDPAHPYYFQFSTGTPFFGIGDTSYGMVSGISDTQRQAYLGDRKAKQFNFIRFFATGSPLAIHSSLTTAEAWPWGGTPEAPNYARLNPQFFRRLDRVIAELKACDMYAEVIVFNYYPTAPMYKPAWSPLHQEMWARYVVSRLSASDRVFLWTVTNEYDLYPRGRYEAFTPEDNEWAEAMAAEFHQFDPHRHPATVHPWEAPQMATPPEDIGPRFAGSPEIDVLSQQHRGKYRWDASQECNEEAEEAAGDHVDAALRRDRRYLMPVINTENSYEWLSDYPLPANFFACTDKARRAAWRIFLGGAATYANGFMGTFAGRDPFNYSDVGVKDGGAPFTLRDEGMGQQIGYYATFISQTDFRAMNPAQHLVTSPTLCLAKPGSEYVVYAPAGGAVQLNLQGQAGSFAVTLLDPRTGGTTALTPIAGGAWRNLGAPAGNDYVFHVKRQETTS